MRWRVILLLFAALMQSSIAPCVGRCAMNHPIAPHSCCPATNIASLQGACCNASAPADTRPQARPQSPAVVTDTSIVSQFGLIAQQSSFASVPVDGRQNSASPPLVLRI
ncbi:MAG TPA: hypothetical protein VK720_15630 [Terracidiphilus sp.]|nr:hypothetical protein [Terracidiphilus sp.]